MKAMAILGCLACGLCWAQPAGDSQPAATNVMGAEYPRIHSDNRVTFQLKAPDASKVQVRIGQTYDMTKAEDGTWSVTTRPLVVGFHYYSLVVDGVAMNDPGSHAFYGQARIRAASKCPKRAWITILTRTCRTAMCGSGRTSPGSRGSGGAVSSTRLRATTPIPRRAIRFCISSTGWARMKRVGSFRDERISSSIT